MSPRLLAGLARRWPYIQTRTPPSEPVGPLVLDEDEECLVLPARKGQADERTLCRDEGASFRRQMGGPSLYAYADGWAEFLSVRPVRGPVVSGRHP
jgi:hypothetical protein